MEIYWENEVPYVEIKLKDEIVLLDLQDLDVLKYKNIRIHKGTGYVRFSTRGRLEGKSLHRVLLDVTDPNDIVDHVNGNKLDNRKLNLRLATPQESVANRAVFKNKKSGLPKGVTRENGKYRVNINYDYRKYHIGMFGTIEQAETAYKKEAERLHGKFASHISRQLKELQ